MMNQGALKVLFWSMYVHEEDDVIVSLAGHDSSRRWPIRDVVTMTMWMSSMFIIIRTL